MAPEVSNDVLQSVSDTEKNALHENHHNEDITTIERTLNTSYEQKSLWWNDAKHDAKVIALKYFSDTYKNNELTTWLDKSAIDINAFVTVRNELWKNFFDNLLYKYDVPYCQIEDLSNDLSALQDAQKHELHENHTKMKARLSENWEPITTQGTEKNTSESWSNIQNESETLQSASNVKVYETLSNIIWFNVLKCSGPERADADKRFELKPLQSFDIKTVEGMIANLNDEQKTTMNQQVNHAIASLKLFLGQDNEKIIKEIWVDHNQIQQILSKLQQVKESMNSKNNAVQKVNSMYELQNIDSLQNWSIVNIFNVEFKINDSFKMFLKESVAIITELGLQDKIKPLLQWWVTNEENLIISNMIYEQEKLNPKVFSKMEKMYNELGPENRIKLNRMKQMMISNNKYSLISANWPEQAKANADYFGAREQAITKELGTELQKQNIILDEAVMNKLWWWLTARWTEQVTQQFNFLQSQSSEWLPKSKLVDMLKVSPFDNAAMQKYDMSHDVSIMLKEITSDVNQPKIKDFSADQFHQLLSDFKTIKKPENKNNETEAMKALKQQDNSPKSLDELITSINEKTNKSNQKTLQKSLQWFVDTFETSRSDSQTESFMNSAMPALEKAWVAISQFGDGINQLFDGLKKSGVWDEIAKICELLFGTWSLEDKLKRFNEIKETEMTLNQSWAFNKWFGLRETKHKDYAKEPLDQYSIKLKKELPETLFNDNWWEKELGRNLNNSNEDSKEYQAFMHAFKEQTKWTNGDVKPSLQDMIVWAHGTPAQKLSINNGTTSTFDDVTWVINAKVDSIYKRSNDEKRDKSKNPNESFSRALIASLITPPKDSLRVARWVMKADQTTKETTDGEKIIDNKIFRDSLELKQENGKLKVETNPSHENRKIQINWKDVDYDKTNGIETKPEDVISIINTQEDNVKKRWADGVKVENITLLTPKFDTKTEWKVKLWWLLDDKDYTATILNDKNVAIWSEGQPLKSWKERELSIDKDKTPSFLILKQDDNGVKQRFAFPKQAETELKK